MCGSLGRCVGYLVGLFVGLSPAICFVIHFVGIP